MSELRVALVAEGPTDAIIIGAALRALLPRPFIITQLQPEHTRPKLGSGWGGVLRWCNDFALRGYSKIEDDPMLAEFDIFILHLDADVAEKSYDDVGAETSALAARSGWPILPNKMNCPPSDGAVAVVRECILFWSGLRMLGPRTVLCVPSKASEAWLAVAVLGGGHRLVAGIECRLNLEIQLAALPKLERLKKTVRNFRAHEGQITDAWALVRQVCGQAERFSTDFESLAI